MSGPAQTGMLRPILAPAVRVDWSQFEGTAALRCTLGVAIPLVVGLIFQAPSISAFGAVGAVSVGFGSFQGAYRSRAAVMVYAAIGMALSVFIGSIAGHSNIAAVAAATIAAFTSGMLVAVGPSAAFVGLQCVVAVLIAGGFPATLREAALRAVTVFGGGLVQTLLVVIIWPLRRFSAERRTLSAAYRALASYSTQLPSVNIVAPEPHTFAAVQSPLVDPQPFARRSEVLVFQALLDEAERIRASLAGFATEQRRLIENDRSCAHALSQDCGLALAEIAAAIEAGREPREDTSIWRRMRECSRRLAHPVVDGLLGQIRAAWRTAGVLTSPEDVPRAPVQIQPLRRRPPVRDAIMTLRANLTLHSTACRHALRLTATIAVATLIYRTLNLPRGYWVPMTALLVLKPEFHDTFARGVSRIAGTILGSGVATLVVLELTPGPAALTVLVLIFVWGCYALFRMNYTIFTICVTGYVVFILMLGGVGEVTAASTRTVYTIAGGVLALAAYGMWPTWAATTARSSLAAMLDAHAAYVEALLGAYTDPARIDLTRLSELRATGRLARSNGEAVIERMLAEPPSRASIGRRAAVGLLAALRRQSLAALALHAGVERGVEAGIQGLGPLTEDITTSLTTLAKAVRAGAAPPRLPSLRQTQLALDPSTHAVIQEETDIMVDAINTIADILTRDAAETTAPQSAL